MHKSKVKGERGGATCYQTLILGRLPYKPPNSCNQVLCPPTPSSRRKFNALAFSRPDLTPNDCPSAKSIKMA